MNPNHLEAWLNYLVAQMNAQHGVAKSEALKTVSRWLRSLGEGTAASEEQPVIRKQRLPAWGRSSRARPSATQTRSAQAHG
jgi:hypothetical protein